jgi:hypothetical protein
MTCWPNTPFDPSTGVNPSLTPAGTASETTPKYPGIIRGTLFQVLTLFIMVYISPQMKLFFGKSHQSTFRIT